MCNGHQKKKDLRKLKSAHQNLLFEMLYLVSSYMRTIFLLSFLLISSNAFAQLRKADSMSYSREKGKYVSGWIEDSPMRIIKTYTGKSKRNYLIKEERPLFDGSIKEIYAEFKNEELDGAYKEYIQDCSLIKGNYKKGQRIGTWYENYFQDHIEIVSTYNQDGKRTGKDVKITDDLNIYEITTVDEKPYLYGHYFQETQRWLYTLSLKNSQSKRNKTIKFKVLLLKTGEIGSIQLIRPDPEFDKEDIEEITNSIFLNAKLIPAKINNELVNCNMHLTFTYLGINKARLNVD